MPRKKDKALEPVSAAVRRAMPGLGFQQRNAGRFVFFSSPFTLTGAYEIPDAALPALARAAFAYNRRSVALYAILMAACLLLFWALSSWLPGGEAGERAMIRKALRLGGVCTGAGIVALTAWLRHRDFTRRHLAGFDFEPKERRAVLFRPAAADGASRIRVAAAAAIAVILGLWALRYRQIAAAFGAESLWPLIVEAEILAIVAVIVGYCVFLARHANRVRRRRVRHADATEIWAEPEIEIAPGHGLPKDPPRRALIWRILFPDFGSGYLADRLERAWAVAVWGSLLSTAFLLWLLYEDGRL